MANRTRRATVFHSASLQPEQLLEFHSTRAFESSWEDCGLDDDGLAALQIMLMCIGPKHWDVIPGTGGVRKMRFGKGDDRGKRGGVRVVYVHFETYGVVVLILAYAKNEQENLTDRQKTTISQLVAELEQEVEGLYGQTKKRRR